MWNQGVVEVIGVPCIAGVDEAGRGPLAGPVVAAAVILDPRKPINGLRDSKRLSPEKRERLAGIIRKQALAWSVSSAGVHEIEALNILGATLAAMRRAVISLSVVPARALIDGSQCPELPCPAEYIVKGDTKVPAISAASILAKVTRDAEMVTLDECYPQYGFAEHKGYPTREHLDRLRRYGACPAHRKGFAPVARVINGA